ncbi:MAG: hypothetical protein C0469_14940 [Cyanobacteria bacterium DS2.3.42]|nr:hypothetical protein [Cyanobacteria bacterium DS2.3.42]
MRTVSVKEAAKALGIGDRAIISRLHNGTLNGVQKPNPYGVNEWRIYPTKEISQNLKLKDVDSEDEVGEEARDKTGSQTEQIDFGPLEEAIDAEAVFEEKSEEDMRREWIEAERSRMRVIAEEMMKPLAEQLKARDEALNEKEKQLQAANWRLGYTEGKLQDQQEQIKLLPDFQARAEKAELLEAEATAAKLRAEELEQALADAERQAKEEIEALKNEKEALTQTVSDLKKPWYKKWFSAPTE